MVERKGIIQFLVEVVSKLSRQLAVAVGLVVILLINRRNTGLRRKVKRLRFDPLVTGACPDYYPPVKLCYAVSFVSAFEESEHLLGKEIVVFASHFPLVLGDFFLAGVGIFLFSADVVRAQQSTVVLGSFVQVNAEGLGIYVCVAVRADDSA